MSMLSLPPELGHVWSAVEYRDTAVSLIKKVKYQHYYTYCTWLARLMGLAYGDLLVESGIDVLVPVPLTSSRQRWRGYNQSTRIAQELGKLLQVSVVTDKMRRIKSSGTQAKKDRLERQALADQFIAHPSFFAGKNVCLIDDVITTGSTLLACTQACLGVGAKTVQSATFAITISGKVAEKNMVEMSGNEPESEKELQLGLRV
jgi:ComF family protein